MNLRIVGYALSVITLLLAATGLGVFERGTSGSRADRSIVSAAPSAGSNCDNVDNADNADNSNSCPDNADNGSDNSDNSGDNGAADNGAADNGAADNGQDNSSGGSSSGGSTGGSRSITGGNTTGGSTGGGDNSDDNFEFEFDIDDDDGDDDDGSSGDGIDDFDLGLPPLPPAGDAATSRVSVCAPAGQETSIIAPDGRATVWVPPSMPQSVRVTLRSLSVTSPSVPPTRGLRVGGLIVGLDAEGCEGGALAALPAEVSLELRYSDLDVSSLNEEQLVLALLDPLDQQWKPVPNQTVNPLTNSISATISTAGIYTVYQPIGW